VLTGRGDGLVFNPPARSTTGTQWPGDVWGGSNHVRTREAGRAGPMSIKRKSGNLKGSSSEGRLAECHSCTRPGKINRSSLLRDSCGSRDIVRFSLGCKPGMGGPLISTIAGFDPARGPDEIQAVGGIWAGRWVLVPSKSKENKRAQLVGNPCYRPKQPGTRFLVPTCGPSIYPQTRHTKPNLHFVAGCTRSSIPSGKNLGAGVAGRFSRRFILRDGGRKRNQNHSWALGGHTILPSARGRPRKETGLFFAEVSFPPTLGLLPGLSGGL